MNESDFGIVWHDLAIQIFLYPEAWWQVYSLWAALALALIVRRGGRNILVSLLVRGKTI